jgi:hypothetical protein
VSLVWLLAWGAASTLWCVTAAQRLGATFDEPLYLERGLETWRSGSHRGLLRLGTMPLPADVQTLPLYLAERQRGRPWDPAADCADLLPTFRAGNLVFWWLLLIYAHLTGARLAGPWGGRLAVALLASEPNLLAHAALATTDVAVTACLLALVHHFRGARASPWLGRVGVPMLWFALALLAKASALVFGPLCLLVAELDRLYLRPREETSSGARAPATWRGRLARLFADLRPFVRDALQIGLGGLALAFVYCGCDWQPEPSFVAWAHGLPEGGWKPTLVWLSDHLRLFSNAGEGLVRQVKHNMHGHPTYLLGVGQEKAIWYYFPVLLSIKLPAALLLLAAALAVLRPRALLNGPCLTAAALLVFSLTCRVQIGVRLVLPLVALAAVGVAAALARAAQDAQGRWPRRVWAGLATAAAAWMALASALVWPHGLCYVNELWGGWRDGYRLVSDSNYDWGQGLPELAEWRRRHADGELDVWYFGSDPRLADLPMRHVKLHVLPIERPDDVPRFLHGPRLAVGATLVYGQGLTVEHQRAAEFLRRHQPVDRTTTFLIYDLSRPPSAPATRAERRRREDAP